MGLFGRNKEQPTQEKQEAGSQVDAALNRGESFNKLILKYNEKHSEQERLDVTNSEDERYRQLMQIHDEIKTMSRDIRTFMQQEIAADGIKLADQDFRGENNEDVIETFLFEKATENLATAPSYLEDVAKEFDLYYGVKKEIAEKEAAIKQMEGPVLAQRAAFDKIDNISLLKRSFNGLFGSKEEKAAIREAQKQKIHTGVWKGLSENQIEEQEYQLKNIEAQKNFKENEFKQKRFELLTKFGMDTGIIAKAMRAAEDRMREAVEKSDDMNLSQAEKTYDQFDAFDTAKSEPHQIDYFEGLKQEDRNKMREQLDNAIKEKVSVEMRGAIESFPLGNRQLDRMEKLIEKYTSKQKIGNERNTENDNSARDFVLRNLKMNYDKLGVENNGDNTLKRYLIKRVCGKMGEDIEAIEANPVDANRLDNYDQRQEEKRQEAEKAKAEAEAKAKAEADAKAAAEQAQQQQQSQTAGQASGGTNPGGAPTSGNSDEYDDKYIGDIS